MTAPTVDAPTAPTRPASNGSRDGRGGLVAAGTPQRRKQLPWAVLGVLLVACSILGFALWTINQGERTPALVAANDIDAGQVIGRADVTAVAIGADSGVQLLTTDERDLVIGAVARGPIPAGTPLSASLVAEVDAVPEGRAIVGASLSPGEYPTSALRAGDRVRLVKVDAASTTEGEVVGDLGVAQIWTVEEFLTGSEPKLFISLVVDQDAAGEIANTISQERLRVVLVGAEQ